MKRQAFTIVELLIVIVIIAILAAITIVAYNGIQQRARASEASAALSQAKKKLELYKVDASSYPITGNLSAAGISNGDVDYQYTSNGTTYCITGTAGNVSYKATETTSPTQGGCAGHGVGGVAAITNYVLNPGFEIGSDVSGGAVSSSGGTRSIQTTGSQSGSKHLRLNFTQSNVGWGQMTPATLATGTYTATFWVRSNQAITFYPYLQGTSTRTVVSRNPATDPVLTPNVWTKISVTFNMTATGNVQLGGYAIAPSSWTTADYLEFDSMMLTSGSDSYSYADGNSLNWTWNGTVNNSTSTGPPL